MVTPLDTLEADFFGDLAEDTHGLWEVFEFVRLHYPDLSDEQVFQRGRDYITRWIDAGWIRISDTPLCPSTITTLSDSLSFLRQHETAATRYLENSPSIDPTDEAIRIYESKPSNQAIQRTAPRSDA
jgi:hypothetical protein